MFIKGRAVNWEAGFYRWSNTAVVCPSAVLPDQVPRRTRVEEDELFKKANTKEVEEEEEKTQKEKKERQEIFTAIQEPCAYVYMHASLERGSPQQVSETINQLGGRSLAPKRYDPGAAEEFVSHQPKVLITGDRSTARTENCK